MSAQCSVKRYIGKGLVANWDTDDVAIARYTLQMLAQWVRDALAHANMSGAELARQLTKRLGRSIDRAAVNKMMMVAATSRTKPRAISADELMAIAEITGFPPPAEGGDPVQRVPRLTWVSAGLMADNPAVDPIYEDAPAIAVSDLPPGDWIALEVQGDSMDRISPPGSIIFVDRNDKKLVPNACYVIANETGEATYKRYRSNPDRFEPVSTNTTLEALYPEGPVRIVGRVRRSLLPM